MTLEARVILLVDDDEADALLIGEALASAQEARTVARARDGAEALEYLRNPANPRPDLIILDLNMPRMSGRELLAVIKDDPNLHLIPTVILTTSNASEDVTGSYGSHANAFVTKPVTLDSFNQAVSNIDLFFLRTATPLPQE
ncbi:MAG TPA: response regulator [Actinocrinis sp.]|nr:response regulator [Actinocrinis sp.]